MATPPTMADDRRRIRVLPELLVRKIAAGEVIERPASVLKELVDNALDAGASRISIAFEDGGRSLIRVSDDGCGMSADDLLLAIKPHATSKLQEEDDLFRITTMGFRGEALASISSVARVKLTSRQAQDVAGHEVQVVADDVVRAESAGCAVGTTIEVRDLFFNVPARRKFLRAASTETGHLNEQVVRFALAFPQVAFEVENNGRITQQLPAAMTRLERIRQLFGAELADAILPVHRQEQGLTLEMYAVHPQHTRTNAQWQYYYVNGRFIRDRNIQHAVRESYRGLLEPTRHPIAFVYISLDPTLVDVNVHPTKIEVRWADAHAIHSQVLSALRERFLTTDLRHGLKLDRALRAVPADDRDDSGDESSDERTTREPLTDAHLAAMKAFADELKNTRPLTAADPPALAPPPLMIHPREGEARRVEDSEGSSWPPRSTMGNAWREAYAPPHPASMQPTAWPGQGLSGVRAVQMHNLYLVVEEADGIMIVDQHALHERVMYEEIAKRMLAGPLESQRLLMPEVVRVSPRDLPLVEMHADLFQKLGMEVTVFGPDSVAIHAFPSLLEKADPPSFLRDLFDKLSQEGETQEPETLIHHVIDMMACKAAVKAGDPLTEAEISMLIARKDLIDKSSNCPHGRPTMLRLSRADLNRQFKRT